MRISDDRYHRDLHRHDVALRFIHLEARTNTIKEWTGLTDDRIRKLHRDYASGGAGNRPVRHRGRSPLQVGFFMRSPGVRDQASVFAGLCRLLDLLPATSGEDSARTLPGLARGRQLCAAYEAFVAIVNKPLLSFERSVLLLRVLARGEELALGNCRHCGALLVVHRWALRTSSCAVCSLELAQAAGQQRLNWDAPD